MDSSKIVMPVGFVDKDALLLKLSNHWILLLYIAVGSIIAVTHFGPAISKSLKSRGNFDLPGPKGWPIIGIGIDLPARPREVFTSWAKKYGSVCKVRVGWYDWVVLSSRAAVKEVFDRQAAVTSAKPPLPMAQEYVLRDYGILGMTYGPRWRHLRALMHEMLTPKASATFIPSQEFEVKQLLADFAEEEGINSEKFYIKVRRMTLSIMMTSAYGIRVPEWSRPEVREVYENMRILSTVFKPGTFWVDTFPPLQYIVPKFLMPSYYMARKMREFMHENTMRHWNNVKAQLAAGTAPDCFARMLMESNYKSKGLNEEVVAWLAMAMPEAGAETTASALNSLILHLAAHPEAQERAAEEVTRVVGSGRLPDMSDESKLPYINAVIKEILRMCPVSTSGLRHSASDDFQFAGATIPKDTILVANVNQLHWDPERFDDPFVFKPERYLNHPQRSAYYINQGDVEARDHFTFGAGRRICPGIHIGENGLFLAVSAIIWAYRFAPPLGPDGKEMPMTIGDAAFREGHIRIPNPYKVRIIPRYAERSALLKSQWADAKKNGYKLRGLQVSADGGIVVD